LLGPQIPALVFCCAKLARFGPPAGVAFLMPAVALAVDQRLPNASPPFAAVAGFAAGLAPKEGVLARPDLGAPAVALRLDGADGAGMEVK